MANSPSEQIRKRFEGVGVRQIRLVSGVILFAYLVSHFLNHALGNISMNALAAGVYYHTEFWQFPPVGIALYTAMLVHFVLGVWACNWVVRKTNLEDPSFVVWDEFVGQWIALLPLVVLARSAWWIVAGFILFRIFDIWKPWPVSLADRDVHAATRRLLEALGYEVVIPASQGCCGALALHDGDADIAIATGKSTRGAFAGIETVLVSASGCFGPAESRAGHRRCCGSTVAAT